ncbi:hypothetical protein Tco_1285604 [Tanacetum coccineum]
MMNTSKDSTEQANKDEVKEVKVESVDYRSPARYNDEEKPVKEKVEVTHLINPKVFKRGCHRGRYGQTTTPWKVVQDVNHKKYSNRDVIVAEDDHDVRHVTRFDLLRWRGCDVLSGGGSGCDGAWLVVVVFASAVGGAEALSASLNDLDFATLNIDGQSTEVKVLPDIINDDGDFIDDEDNVPHDLADSHDEVLANADDYDEVASVVCEAEKPTGDAAGEATGMDARRGCVKKPRTSHPRKAVDVFGPLVIPFEWIRYENLIFISGRIMGVWSNTIVAGVVR